MHILKYLNVLIKYSWLLQELIIRDLKIKYRRSVLGYFWSILNPLMMMAIITIVFSNVFRFDIPNYPVYLLAGQLIYTFFSESTNMAMNSILWGASLIKKIYLPKYIFPLSRVLSCFVTMLFSIIALFLVMLITDVEFHITLLLMPFAFLSVLVFCIGIGLILSVLVVFFRDFQHLYGVLLTGLGYLTPIFYPISILPEWLRDFMVLNPLYSFINFFRKIAIYGQWPSAEEYVICMFFSVGSLIIGLYIFKKYQNDFILYI